MCGNFVVIKYCVLSSVVKWKGFATYYRYLFVLGGRGLALYRESRHYKYSSRNNSRFKLVTVYIIVYTTSRGTHAVFPRVYISCRRHSTLRSMLLNTTTTSVPPSPSPSPPPRSSRGADVDLKPRCKRSPLLVWHEYESAVCCW